MAQSAFLWLQRRQYLLLVVVLVLLHLVAAAGPETWWGRALWLCDVGLFLLWQPFVGSDRRLGGGQIGVIVVGVLALVWQLGWGWLALWYAFLAALVGGKVVMARGRRHRWFYLFAFAYLVGGMLVWISPNIVAGDHSLADSIDGGLHGLAALFLAALLAALPRTADRRPAELHDFLASLLILLLLLVLLLGTVTLMSVYRIGYYEALVLALLGAGLSLLLLSWAWDPKPGFGGLGASLSRYLLRIGLDVDGWLKRQLDLAETEDDAEGFIARSLDGFADLPWVAGGEWEARGISGSFGEPAAHVTAMAYQGIAVRLYTPYAWSASLVWQANLLFKLTVELYQAKERETRLRQMEYLQAVHESGARLTHDIKNLLQSIEALCYAIEQSSADDSARLADLIRRQLPALGQRLKGTLAKLQHPETVEATGMVDAPAWWERLQRRFAVDGVRFVATPAALRGELPMFLFDSVADNLLSNATYKHREDPDVEVVARLVFDADGGAVFSVEDSGAAVPPELAGKLMAGPVASTAGLGIGLYQAARLANGAGYELCLAENRNGAVRFELRPQRRSPSQ